MTTDEGQTSELTVAVMIPTYRRHDILRRSLGRWRLSRRRPDQMIVVDASPDAAEERTRIVTDFADLFAGAGSAYLVSPIASISQQRNLALPILRTDVVVFADDETEPSPDYLDKLLEVYRADVDRQVAGVGGLLDDWAWRLRDGFASVVARPVARRVYMTQEQAFPLGTGLPTSIAHLPVKTVRNLVGNRMSFRSSVARAEGFDPLMLRYSFLEDLDISVRASRTHRIVMRGDATIKHRPGREGRIGSTAMFLTSFVNPAYLVEKLFPTDVNRRPLDRLVRLSETIMMADPRVLLRATQRRRVRERHAVARAMIAYIRSGSPAELGQRYAALQGYIHGEGPESPTLGTLAAATAWIGRQRAAG